MSRYVCLYEGISLNGSSGRDFKLTLLSQRPVTGVGEYDAVASNVMLEARQAGGGLELGAGITNIVTQAITVCLLDQRFDFRDSYKVADLDHP